MIGDLHTVALVGTDGTIDWYCPPAFDSPSVFGAILDSERAGYYRISAIHDGATKQLYLPDTNVLITRFLSPDGVGELQDFMPVGDKQRLIRRVVCSAESESPPIADSPPTLPAGRRSMAGPLPRGALPRLHVPHDVDQRRPR